MLRPYQIDSIDKIRAEFRSGKRKVMLRLATGAGKTVIFSEVMKKTVANGKRAIMVVRGRQLVDQASQRLFREHVFHGVYMSDHWNKKPSAPIQICSIDTLLARNQFPDADLVVIDEADQATSEGYVRFADMYPKAHFLSVTATPYGKLSLKHVAETCVSPISMRELVAQGYLVDAKVFAPFEPNMSGVRTVNGDYSNSETEKRMSTLTGDIVENWKLHGQDRASICFAVNISHSKTICDQFNRAGIVAEHIEADNSLDERQEVIGRLQSGKTKIICNVGIVCRGVDIPFASCLIMARPTKSYNLFVQQYGRGTRIHEGKNDFLVLDHAGNFLRHGFPHDEPEVNLDGQEIKPKLVGPYRCKKCFSVYDRALENCPVCGEARETQKRAREIEIADGILRQISSVPQADHVAMEIAKLKIKCKERGYKPGWVWYQVRDRFGEEIANKTCTRAPDWILNRSTTD